MDNEQKEAGFTLEQWAQTKRELFDKKDIFDAEIEPLMKQLHKKCEEHSVPIGLIITFKSDESGDYSAAAGFVPSAAMATPSVVFVSVAAKNPDDLGVILNFMTASRERALLSIKINDTDPKESILEA